MLLASPITHTSPMSLGYYSKSFLLFGVLNLLSSGWPWFELRDQQQSEWLLPFHHSFTQTHLYLLHPPSINISSNSTHGAKDIFFPPYGYPWGNLLHQRSFNCNIPLVILNPQGCSLSRKAKSKHMKTLDRFLSSLFHILAIILENATWICCLRFHILHSPSDSLHRGSTHFTAQATLSSSPPKPTPWALSLFCF